MNTILNNAPRAASSFFAAHPTFLGQQNFWKWFGDSKILYQDTPLEVYHATAASFDTFESHASTAVYRLDGKEVRRADSWDMGDDRKGAPAAFHYGALSDVQTLGVDEALRVRTAEAACLAVHRGKSERSPDTDRHLGDLVRMQGKTLTVSYESRPTGDGFYFTPAKEYSYIRDIGHREGGIVMPVFLAIRNPVYLNALQIESAGASYNVEKYKALGYDGAIYSEHPEDLTRWNFGGATQIVAFDAHQAKSSIGNNGAFSNGPNICC